MKTKKLILFVFTCAAIEVVYEDHQQEGNNHDPGHDGSVETLFTTEMYMRGERLTVIYRHSWSTSTWVYKVWADGRSVLASLKSDFFLSYAWIQA